MNPHFEELLSRLSRQGLAEAERHFVQAKAAFDRSEWESANSQIRAGLESLFNSVALIRLHTKKTGGPAREALENAKILRSREARLVQEFMAVAGGSGSHAGVSNADESLGRLLVGMGVAFFGLSLIPELVRVEDVVIGQLTAPTGTRLPTDREIHTCCPTCRTEQNLSQASLTRRGDDTVYTCCNGCQVIVVVGIPGDTPIPDRGYRLGPHVIRNTEDLFLPVLGTNKKVLIPKSKNALIVLNPTCG